MSKFSANFERKKNDFYRTFDKRAHKALADIQEPVSYAEPCVGYGDLVKGLSPYGFKCEFMSDLVDREESPIRNETVIKDAMELTKEDVDGCEYIISNTPWLRKTLHPMITHFSSLKPTWLLFESDWSNTKQAIPYLNDLCTDIASIGRMTWEEGTKTSGTKDMAWYRFSTDKNNYIRFHTRKL